MMKNSPYLDGQLLIAMPTMADTRFERSVIFVCSHDETGAMGIIINQPLSNMKLSNIMSQLNISLDKSHQDETIFTGGPVEPGRGFVIHTADYSQESTKIVSQKLAITSTTDVLHAIAKGEGPDHYLIALGYAGWGAGQLDRELQENSWLNSPADTGLIFQTEPNQTWPRSMAMMGIDISMLSTISGRA